MGDKGATRKVLERLQPDEAGRVLRSLLDRHPELLREAQKLARAVVTDVDVGLIPDLT